MSFNPLSIVSGILKSKGEIKAAKEQKKVADQNSQLQYESGLANESNRENDRLARTQGIAQQLTGARGLSPEVIAAALQRRASTVRKGVNVDQSKGMGWGMAGGAVNALGDLAGTVISGGMKNAADAGMGILHKSAQVGAPCPPGTQGSNGECY